MTIFFLIIVVVLFFLIIIEVRALEYLFYEHLIERGCTEIVLLAGKTISSMPNREQFLSDLPFTISESFGYLATICTWINSEESLRRAYQIPIRMSYPELAHVPGIVSYLSHDLCMG